MKRIAIFDFDGTLVRGDSFLTFPMQILGRGHTIKCIIQWLPDMLKWKLGRISNADAKERLAHRLYRGMNKVELKKKGWQYQPGFRPAVIAALERHKAEDDEVWIISASLDIWLESIADKLNVKLLCTETATDASGNLTGEFSTSNCYGEEKVRRLLDVRPELDNLLITAYGDRPSKGDAAIKRIATQFITIH